ncbi:MAG: BofC C-terminal domain-containing protein [Lutisporaceae bacterium]
MFENRNRQRKKNIGLVIVALFFFIAFGFGYYLNYDENDNISNNTINSGDTADYRIPDSIRNPYTTVDAEAPEDQSTNASTDNFITPSTKVIFKTYFTLCGHMLDKDPENMEDLINLSEEELKLKFTDWKVNEFSKQQVILSREISTYCPRHYIIGVKDGYIAIYVYDAEGKKILYEETEISISTLTAEDQKNLEYGIIADSEDELQQKLEGFSE